MDTTRERRALAPRDALAWTGAVLIAYVGLVHEAVGARLYPDGPALFGGPVPWHAAGVAGIAAGLALVAHLLGVVRVPQRALAVVCGTAGVGALVLDAVVHHGFHFFAATMVVAALLVGLTAAPAAPEGHP